MTTDGALGTAVALSGPEFLVDESLGARAGDNLFHSFSEFSLNASQSARFTGSATIQHVINRVTGGEASLLDGALVSEIGSADFYFINPAGVVFGPNAVLDVPAAFYVAAADALHFADGVSFNATAAASTLSVAAPEGFGFLGGAGALRFEGAQLALTAGQRLVAAGADLSLTDTEMTAPGGVVELYATGSGRPGEILFDAAAAGAAAGDLTLSGAQISVSADGAGRLGLYGGTLEIRESAVYNSNQGEAPAPGMTRIEANRLTVADSSIQNAVFASGSGAELAVRATDSLTLEAGARMQTLTQEAGNAGALVIEAGRLVLVEGGAIRSYTTGSGAAGDVQIRADDLTADRAGGEAATGVMNQTFSAGPGGTTDITVAGSAELLNGALLTNSARDVGDAGALALSAGSLRIDGGNLPLYTGVTNQTGAEASGAAGDLTVVSSGDLEVLNGGLIASETYGAGDGGRVQVSARDIRLDGAGGDWTTGVIAWSQPGASGDSGDVELTASGALLLREGGRISSTTFSAGDAGQVLVQAGALEADDAFSSLVTGITSQANSQSTGDAGEVRVQVAEDLVLRNGARITGSTFSEGRGGQVLLDAGGAIRLLDGGGVFVSAYGAGDAGSVTARADALAIDGSGPGLPTGIFGEAAEGSSGNAGSVHLEVRGLTEIGPAGAVSSSTYGPGRAGDLYLESGALRLDQQDTNLTAGIISQSEPGGGGAGRIDVRVRGAAEVLNGAEITTSTYSGAAGDVYVEAGRLTIDGNQSAWITGITSQSYAGDGDAGAVVLQVAGPLAVLDGGLAASSTFADGDAGRVEIHASELRLDRGLGPYVTGIINQANNGSSGDAGEVRVRVDGAVQVLGGAAINSNSYGEGNAGSVDLRAASLEIASGSSDFRSGVTSEAWSPGGAAGDVQVRLTDGLWIGPGGRISSTTRGDGDAGAVAVDAGTAHIERGDSEWNTGILSQSIEGAGDAGGVSLVVTGALEVVNGGLIDSSTFALGEGGDVLVQAGDLLLDRQGGAYSTAISAQTHGDAGSGGAVTVAAEHLLIRNGAGISTTSHGVGDAGRVNVQAGRLEIQGVESGTLWTTGILSEGRQSGAAGDLVIQAGEMSLSSGAAVSIGSYGPSGSADPGGRRILIIADRLELDSDARIRANSTNLAPAAELDIRVAGVILLQGGSGFFTQAIQSDGGPIRIDAGALALRGSWITTSVEGPQGDGGDIDIRADAVLLDRGFIQANTKAADAAGGDIDVDVVQILSPWGVPLLVGGNQRVEFDPAAGINVVQAAAPNGVSGKVVVAEPPWDIAASLGALSVRVTPPPAVTADPCRLQGGQVPSSLYWSGGAGGGLEIRPFSGCDGY